MRLLVIGLILALGLFAKANDRVSGNGGDGIILDGKLYLLDLVEEGVEANPLFPKTLDVHPAISKILDSSLARIDIDKKLLGAKITQIFNINRVFALHIAQAINTYNWVMVNSSLVDIPDEDSVIDYGGKPLVQIAIRRDHSIRISRDAWAQLDDKQKVAVILHETLYALNMPFSAGERNGYTTYTQSSPKSRELNGYLFSPALLEKGNAGLETIGDQYFPTSIPYQTSFRLNQDNDSSQVEINPTIYLKFESYYLYEEIQPKNTDEIQKFIDKVCNYRMTDETRFMNIYGRVYVSKSSIQFDSYLNKAMENSTYLQFTTGQARYSPFEMHSKETSEVTPAACTSNMWQAFNKAREYVHDNFSKF